MCTYGRRTKGKTEACEQLQDLQDMLRNYLPFNSGTVAFSDLGNMLQTAILIPKDAINYSLPKRGILLEIF